MRWGATERSAPVQPIPERPHPDADPKENAYGRSSAEKQSDGGKTKYDEPSVGAEDFAIDEARDKRIRGNEAPKDVSDPE